MRLGLLYDHSFNERPGGASRFADRMLRAVPAGVDVIPCPPGTVDRDCDAYALYQTKRYSEDEYAFILDRPFVRFEQDYWRDGDGGAPWRDRLNERARLVAFCSPLHRDMYQVYHGEFTAPTVCIAPPLDPAELAPFREKRADGERSGTIWFGEWSWGKAPDIAQRWALENEAPTDFYSPNIPEGTRPMNGYSRVYGFKAEEAWWDVVAGHARYIHFPRQPEPWSYSAHEAYVLGLEVVIAGRFGIESWDGGIERAVEDAAESPRRWWEVALNVL